MLQAVIFDVDGTLLDTERIYMRAWKEAGKQLGYDVPDELLRSTRAVNVKDATKIFEETIGNGFSYAAVRVERVRIAEEIIQRESPILRPGVMTFLNYLRERKIPMAVASSTDSKTTAEHLALSGILDFFSVVVGGEMIQHGKPNPDIFLKTAELLKVEPSCCLVAEDAYSGIRAASSAGMMAVMIPDIVPANDEMRALSYAVTDRLDQIIPMVEKLL